MLLFKNKKFGSIFLGIVSSVLSLCYPFAFYFYGADFPFGGFLIALFLLMILRLVINYIKNQRKWAFFEKNIMIYGGIVGLSMTIAHQWDPQLSPYVYPVITNITFGLIFAKSLLFPPSLIERLARIKEPDLDEHGKAYTRKVTWVWMLFCFINGFMSALTALAAIVWGEKTIWAIYNGVISYCLMGVLMVSEYLIRRWVRSQRSGQ